MTHPITYATPVTVYTRDGKRDGLYWFAGRHSRSWVVIDYKGATYPALVQDAQIDLQSITPRAMPTWARKNGVGLAWCINQKPSPPSENGIIDNTA